jgi:hypothetical protein
MFSPPHSGESIAESQPRVRHVAEAFRDLVRGTGPSIEDSGRPDVAKCGRLALKKVNGAITDLLVDLKFRGDYTGHARGLLQKACVENDLYKVQDIMGNRNIWRSVPQDRFLTDD